MLYLTYWLHIPLTRIIVLGSNLNHKHVFVCHFIGVLITEFLDPNAEEKKFNPAFRTLRCAVERAIGLWKAKWGALHHKRFGPLLYEPSKEYYVCERPLWMVPKGQYELSKTPSQARLQETNPVGPLI